MMQNGFSVVKRLHLREVTGSLSFKVSGGNRCRIYDKCPEHLQISLRNIISQKNLLLGHVIIGFSRNGKYILSYQCKITEDMDEGCLSLQYKYYLHWWKFHYKTPAKKVHMVPLFIGEHIDNALHLLICQPPCGRYIVVHGSTSRQIDRSNLSSSCYVTVAPSPAEHLSKGMTNVPESANTFSVHLKYELVPPHPPFMPSVNLKLRDTILLNSGDMISAVKCFVNSKNDMMCENDYDSMFGPRYSMNGCLCSLKKSLLRKENIENSYSDNDDDKSLAMPACVTMKSPDGLNNDSNLAETHREPCGSQDDCISLQTDGVCYHHHHSRTQSSSSCQSTTSDNQRHHTSCYVNYYNRRLEAETETVNAPFDCTSTAFPVKVTTVNGENIHQTSTHRCMERTELDQLTYIDKETDIIVKQTVFDAEQFLDSQFQCIESIKDKFVSLKDYDLQIVQICASTQNVIILIKALVNLRANESSCRLSTFMTGFLFSWNIQTGNVDIFEQHPVVEFQKPKCKSRSIFHGLEQAVELRKRHFLPSNLTHSVLSFSNHTVFSGKSKKYLLHPFQPLAIVM